MLSYWPWKSKLPCWRECHMAERGRQPLGFENLRPNLQGTKFWQPLVSLEKETAALTAIISAWCDSEQRIQETYAQIPDPQKSWEKTLLSLKLLVCSVLLCSRRKWIWELESLVLFTFKLLREAYLVSLDYCWTSYDEDTIY